MESLIRTKQNVQLRRIDINTWNSQVARQFGIRRLPTVWLFNGTEKVTTDRNKALARITKLD